MAEAKYDAGQGQGRRRHQCPLCRSRPRPWPRPNTKVNKKANDEVPGSVPTVRMNELFLKCKETKLAIEKATLDQKVAGEEAKVAKAEVEAAKVMVERHKVLSPIAGEVVDIRAHKGESVQPIAGGDPRREARQPVGRRRRAAAAKFARAELDGRNVTVDVDYPQRPEDRCPAKSSFS